jgi:lipopolysaccharide transport system ATP-binding protein
MSDIAIRIENLSKQYKIVTKQQYHENFRDQLMEGLRSIFRQNERIRPDKETIWALKNISFEVKKGEIVGFVGGNGAGKSTMLKILSRITKPSSGRAEIYGSVGSLLEVGTGFDFELNGRENIYLNGAILGMKKAEIDRKFDEIVSFSGIEKFVETPVKRYSSGMYVRLAFAVAAHLDPEILFIDEVLAVGDAAFQKKCLGKLDEVAKGGRTILFVSHNMIAVTSLCNRVIWLKNGEIVSEGFSRNVVTEYMQDCLNDAYLSEMIWEEITSAPGNEKVRLHRVRVRPQGGNPSDPITRETPFLAEVEYWNLVPDEGLQINLHLHTEFGIIVLTTSSVHDSLWESRPMQIGLFRSVCHFPANLLNSGQHFFYVVVEKGKGTLVYRHETEVIFNILDLAERQGANFNKEPGVVQPLLKWETEYLGKDERIRSLSLRVK